MKSIKELTAARDKLLEEKPHLKKYQAEVDRILDGSPENMRQETLAMLLAGQVIQLNQQLAVLKGALNNADDKS